MTLREAFEVRAAQEFSPGDVIRCITVEGLTPGWLTEGQTYTVLSRYPSLEDTAITLADDDGRVRIFCAFRFEPAE